MVTSAVPREVSSATNQRGSWEEDTHGVQEVERAAGGLVDLNVGGEIFTARRRTLCLFDGTLLASMFSGRWEQSLIRDASGRVFLELNPLVFRKLLDYLVMKSREDPDMPVPQPTPPEGLKSEWEEAVRYLGLEHVFREQQEAVRQRCRPCVEPPPFGISTSPLVSLDREGRLLTYRDVGGRHGPAVVLSVSALTGTVGWQYACSMTSNFKVGISDGPRFTGLQWVKDVNQGPPVWWWHHGGRYQSITARDSSAPTDTKYVHMVVDEGQSMMYVSVPSVGFHQQCPLGPGPRSLKVEVIGSGQIALLPLTEEQQTMTRQGGSTTGVDQ